MMKKYLIFLGIMILAVSFSGCMDPASRRVSKTSTPAAVTYVYNTQWGSLGSGNGQFNSPRGMAVDSSGNVYVADTGNNRIQKFSPQ